MSKLETVRDLNASQSQLAIVTSIRELQQTISLMHQELEYLPAAISAEMAQSLEPLTHLRTDVKLVLEAYSQLTAIQRRTMDDLVRQMTESAAKSFEQKLADLSRVITDLSRSWPGRMSSLSRLDQTATLVAALPDQLASSQRSMTKAAEHLIKTTKQMLPNRWWQVMMPVMAGIVGALLVATGQTALSRLVPPSAEKQELAVFRALWAKASPRERELLKQIANRPAR